MPALVVVGQVDEVALFQRERYRLCICGFSMTGARPEDNLPERHDMTVLHHRADGAGTAPPLILGPSLGTSLSVWEPQAAALARGRQVIRYDLPGHGGSPAGLLPAAATVGDVAGLVLALADRLGIDRFAYAGISFGGAVGTWLAVNHPERVTSLMLICTSAHFGEPGGWHERARLVRTEGMVPVADTAAGRWFTPSFVDDPAAQALVADLRTTDATAYAASCDALASFDLRAELSRITAPTLVVAGREDLATPVDHARLLADRIPGASLTEVAHAAHLVTVERPAPVLAALRGHLDSHSETRDATVPSDDGSRYAAGMAVRRAVLGDAHVARAIARTTEFTSVFQDFITRYAWGEVWTRPGRSRTTRRCMTLTPMIANGHHDELGMHIRAALQDGLTPADIQEVLLQSAIYCGVPAANTAFAIAGGILEEHDS
ncbi:3-oxoadipate enol-lactonase [Amycolatopsis sp. FDAARGOS 1241]|uniref:bifunctional 3-oxoadipate enol-lactonase/4-carboxymuconolactone decarboxylase PcaDC n=1 Tax=Amycolatopsis sp. FDAARGOS 1241 TaxID=2778070 RepID=UPI00351C063C